MALIAAFVLGGALNSGASVWTNLAGGNASGTWGAAANWSGGIPNGTDAVADFSTLAVTANSMITNDAARTIGTLLFAGTAPGNDWTVTGSPLTLAVSSGTPAIVVGNQAASIATALTGSQGFTKGGAGILELTGTNAYGGATVVTNGTLQLAGALTMPSGTVGFWQFNNSANLGADSSGAGDTLTTASGNPVYSSAGKFGGALYLNGSSTMTTLSGAFPHGVPTNASSFTIAVWEKADAGCPNNGGFVGWGDNVGNEANNLRLNGANSLDAYWFNNDFVVNGLAVNPMDGNWHAIVLTWNGVTETMYVDGASVGSRSPATPNIQAANFLVGKTTGDVDFLGWLEDLLIVNRALTAAEIATYQTGFSAVNSLPGGTSVQLSSGGVLDLNGSSQTVASLTGDATTSVWLEGNVLTVNNAAGASFAGTLSGFGSLVKSGAGTLTLSGTNANTGGTTISAGTLALTAPPGATAAIFNSASINVAAGAALDVSGISSGLQLAGGQTLGGAGGVHGAVVVGPGATLQPSLARSGISTLTFNNALNLAGSLILNINRTNTQKADLVVAPSLVLGGTVTIQNAGPAPVLGDSFTLLAVSGVLSNNQFTGTLPSLSSGLSWDVSSFSVNGTLKVAAAQATNVIGATNWPNLLAQQVQTAYSAGFTNVTINPGTYVMPNGGNPAFSFSGWQNFTLNASNVLFTVGAGDCFDVLNCTNVVIEGATVRSQSYPFTQGRVTAIGSSNGVLDCDWTISAGYPNANFQWSLDAVSASNQTINLQQGDFGPGTSNYLGNNVWHLTFPGRSGFAFQTNDWLVARYGSQGFAYLLGYCSNCTLLNCTSQCGGFGTFREWNSISDHILGCQIQPAPVPPPGGSELPVVANQADGFHVNSDVGGPDIENFTCTNVLLDDCIAIHGQYQSVASVSGYNVTFNLHTAFPSGGTGGSAGFAVGQPVRISDTNGFFAQANCTAIQNQSNDQVITLDKQLAIPVGALGGNPDAEGSGYKIINCQLGNTRSRAIIPKADNGLIAGCTISGAGSGMQLGPEYYWGEADYVWNVTVSNNVVENCGYSSITVVSDGAIGNQNIAIQNNTIENLVFSDGLSVSGCNGLTVTGNTFISPDTGYNPIWLSNCTNISLAENFVTNNAAGVNALGLNGSVTGLQGQQNGIVLADLRYAMANELSALVLGDPGSGGAGTQIAQQANDGGPEAQWSLAPAGAGCCAIYCGGNGLVLGVGGSSAINAPLVLEAYTGASEQLWLLAPDGATAVQLINVMSGLAASVQTSSAAEVVRQQVPGSSTGQGWVLQAGPGGLAASPGDGQVAVSWQAVSGATSYTVSRSLVSGGPYSVLASGLASPACLNTGLANGATYYYVVAAVIGASVGVNSAEVRATPSIVAAVQAWFKADAITGLANGAAVSSWTDSSGHGHSASAPISAPSYITAAMNGLPVVRFNSGAGTYLSFARPVQDDFTIMCVFQSTQGLNSGTLYYQGAGLVNGEVPGAVNDFGTCLFANGSISGGTGNPDVAVDSAAGFNNGHPHIMSLVRKRSTGSVSLYVDGALAGTTTGGTQSLTSPGVLVLGAQQTLNNYLTGDIAEVKIFNSPLPSGDRVAEENALKCKYSVGSGAAPASPTGLTVAAGNLEALASWVPTAGATSYNLFWSTNSGGNYLLIASGLTNCTYADANAMSGVTNFYKVAAVDGCGASAASPAAGVLLPLPALAIGNVGAGWLTLSWPGWAGGWTLYSTTNLVPPIVWQPVTNTAASNNGMFNATAPISAGVQYFHLAAP